MNFYLKITHVYSIYTMPRYAKRRRRPRRRRRKLPYRRRKKRSVPLPLNGFPSSKMVRFRYADTFALDPAAGAVATHIFRANSLYDPDSTETGHSPPNFDTWMSIYNHYTVIGSKITVSFTPTTTTSVNPGILGCMLTDSGTEVGSMSLTGMLEQGKVRYGRQPVGISNANASSQRVVSKFSASKFFGKPKATIINDGTYRGSTTSNPTEQAWYEVFFASVEGNNPGAITVLAVIDYIAILNEKTPDTVD